jgi:nucleoid-associated protein YgaU
MRQRLLIVGAGLILAIVVVRVIVARPGADDVAVDTTGASAEASSAGRLQTGTTSTPPGASTGPLTAPGAAAKPVGPTPTPVVVQIQGTAVSIEAKPLVLLNPSSVRQGSSVGVTGSGFDPGATVDIFVKQQPTDEVDPLTFVQVDKSGGFGGVTFAVPDSLPRGSFVVEALQRESANTARATAVVAGTSPQVKLGTQAAKAGDLVQLSAAGFGPEEDVNVYWNDLSSDVIAVLQTDPTGGIRQGAVRVPFGAVGNNAFVFVGTKSQSPVTVPFQMLNLYPSVDLSSYAIKPDNVLSFSGKDFGPDERITVYLNNPAAPPLTTIQADEEGGFNNAGGFLVPFGLRGKQTLIFIGTESKAPTTASFDTLPYTPSAQPSTYGGRPGTTLTFYAIGFARNEIVHAFVGRTAESAGQQVSCFRTDAQGNAASGGSYVVPGDALSGQLLFTLIGSRSQAAAAAALEVIASDVPVQVPPTAGFECELTDGPDVPQVVGVLEGPHESVGTTAAVPEPEVVPAASPPAAANPSPAAAPQNTSPTADTKPSAPSKPSNSPAAKPNASPTARPSNNPAAKPNASPTAKPNAAAAKPQQTPRATATLQPPRPTATSRAATPGPQPPAEPTPIPAAAEPTQTEDSPPAAAANPETYTIREGDTLPSIANQFYGDASAWRTIYEANSGTIGDDPNLIRPGTPLTIPTRES